MISKIAFYILNNESSIKGRDLYTCRIIEKAYNSNHKIYVYTSNLEETKTFDNQLWTFSDISFIPHEIYNESSNNNQNAQILIGHIPPLKEFNDILISFTKEVTPFYQQFNHLIEVIPNEETCKSLARNRFQIYQKDGHKPEVFNV